MHGIMITSGDANIAHHNIVCCNHRGGIEVNWGTGSTNTKLYDNTIYKNRGEGLAIGSNNRNVTLKNNIVFLNAGAIVDYGSTGAIRSDNVTSSDR
jgi:parallel beta-helix repeat protein